MAVLQAVGGGYEATRHPRGELPPRLHALGLRSGSLAPGIGRRNCHLRGRHAAWTAPHFGALRKGLRFRASVALGRVAIQKRQDILRRIAVSGRDVCRLVARRREARGRVGACGGQMAHLVRATEQRRDPPRGAFSDGRRGDSVAPR